MELHPSLVGDERACDQAQQSALALPVRPDYADRLTDRDLEAHVAQCPELTSCAPLLFFEEIGEPAVPDAVTAKPDAKVPRLDRDRELPDCRRFVGRPFVGHRFVGHHSSLSTRGSSRRNTKSPST